VLSASRVVLVVDANIQRNGPALDMLGRGGWATRAVTSRSAALTVLGETTVAAIVLYPGRFDGTGFELISAVRRLRRAVPIAVVLGGSRSTASAEPRLLWFAAHVVDDALRAAILLACGVGAGAAVRRDARETVPVPAPASAFESAFEATFSSEGGRTLDDEGEVTRPGVLRPRAPGLRDLERYQLRALDRAAR
jgi:CheY-like chemotaxis protein